MRAGVLTGPRRVEIADVIDPPVTPGTVLVRMSVVGICGSDLHTYRGEHPFRKPPVILGHEGAGRVAGSGERVAILPSESCRACRECETGLLHLCARKRVPGSGWAGFLSDYVTVPRAALVPLDPDTTDGEGAMIEPVAVAWHAVRTAGVLPGQSVAVIGAGAIGGLVAMVCQLHRADPLLVSDVRPAGLRALAGLGVARTVNAAVGDVVTAGRALVDGFDAVIVASGHPACLDEAFGLVRPRGTVVVLPMFGAKVTADVNPVVLKEIVVRGSTTYSPADFRAAARLVGSRDIDVRPFITETIPLDQVPKALEAMDRGGDAIKVQVSLDA
jgi:L-iditol 2-dehydrogenase